MLSFYAVRGIKPEYLLSLTPLERAFYKQSMELWYKEMNGALRVLGGARVGENY
jgi:hypothetical protein|nr:MAG TPA: hypothetical protein [Caudoviricetes sp.]DAT63665.1 MAG TPA: hypothetical protein [Caudoviricetes sp.]